MYGMGLQIYFQSGVLEMKNRVVGSSVGLYGRQGASVGLYGGQGASAWLYGGQGVSVEPGVAILLTIWSP